MKKALFSVILGCSPLWVPVTRGEEASQPPPEEHQGHEAHEEEEEAGRQEARMQEETVRFTREMEERMKGAMEKAAALEAEGKPDAAEQMRKEAKQKLESSIQEHRRAMQAKMREQQQRQRAERQERAARERAERRERQPADRPDGERRPDGPPAPELKRKLHHVEQAIGHLREADLPDPAHNLERVADRLRQALHDHREHGPGPHGPRPEAGPPRDQPRRDDDLAALRRDMEELKKLVADLCKMQGHGEKKEAGEKHH